MVRGNHTRRLGAFWWTVAGTVPQAGPPAVVYASESIHPCGPLPLQERPSTSAIVHDGSSRGGALMCHTWPQSTTVPCPGVGKSQWLPKCSISSILGGTFALRAHCALLFDYVPPEESPSTPLGNALRIK